MRAALLRIGEQHGFRIYAKTDYVDVATPRSVRLRPAADLEVWGLVESGQILLVGPSVLRDRDLFERFDRDYGQFRLDRQFGVYKGDVAEIGATKPGGAKFYHRWTHPVGLWWIPKIRSYLILSHERRQLWGTFPENAREFEALNRRVFGGR